MKLWREEERKWKRRLFHPIGVLFLAADEDDAWEAESRGPLDHAGIPYKVLSRREMKKRWPQICFDGVDWGLFEPESGYLLARAACQAVVQRFVEEGGEYRRAMAVEDSLEKGAEKGVRLSDGSWLKADRYVFACGPWMGQLFPRTIGDRIQATQQDVFFFGTPAGDARFDETHLPVWADHRGRFMYGIPGAAGRGFKMADDTRGPGFDPTQGERVVSSERLRMAREYLEFRFPGMKKAPLIKGRVCQYEQTPDSHFIVDRHPSSEPIWLVGGGSGHGFKHGPALGELVAGWVIADGEAFSEWRLARFKRDR
jgi:glycine/D-amino acid oxidase-like deaminating enzyme